MNDSPEDRVLTPGEYCAERLQSLADHVGMVAESRLLDVFGRNRLKALYEGAEPRLGELAEISEIFGVPVTTFLMPEKGGCTALDLAFVDLRRLWHDLAPEDRQRLIERILSIVENDDDDPTDLPRSVTRALRRVRGG